jgi:hypothetical protein
MLQCLDTSMLACIIAIVDIFRADQLSKFDNHEKHGGQAHI